jgi:hypothetical protein
MRPLHEEPRWVALEAALAAIRRALSRRAEDLAHRSTAGALTPDESREYADLVRLNDTLSLAKLRAEKLWTASTPSR